MFISNECQRSKFDKYYTVVKLPASTAIGLGRYDALDLAALRQGSIALPKSVSGN